MQRNDYNTNHKIITGSLVIGIACLGMSLSYAWMYVQSIYTAQKQRTALTFHVSARQALEPKHITIAWFVDTPIETLGFIDNQWGTSVAKATYWYQSARPSEGGNTVIYGHNTREILGNIRALKGGEEIVLTLNNGSQKRYTVTQAIEVSPSDISLLRPTNSEVLTLYTCSGLFDLQRFVVRAIPKIQS